MRTAPFVVAAALLVASVSAIRLHQKDWRIDMRSVSSGKLRGAGAAQWFEQRLDQFDPANPRTIKLRYLVNETFWGGPGYPVFVWLGGESAMSLWDLGGFYVINEYAQRYRGLMVAVEHRFYGESVPEGGLTIENLRYLNSLQAIADYASFIDFVVTSKKASASKVVTQRPRARPGRHARVPPRR
eukprot:m51a1_g6488 putative serine carboxypeptidase family protein (185) ;mRNA; f:150780-151655